MRALKILLLSLVVVVSALLLYAPYLDSYDASGTVKTSALSAPVKIIRDDKGIPYIYADTLNDAVFGQGFVIAQDRLFQLQLMRQLSQGRLSELVGDGGIAMDTMVHLLNIPELGRKQAAMLTEDERQFYQRYVDGVNAYLKNRSDELALPFRSNPPPPWSLEELITVQVFNYWGSTTNWREELLSQSLIDHLGLEAASEISQITVNADDEKNAREASDYHYKKGADDSIKTASAQASAGLLAGLVAQLPAPDHTGSNAWITGPKKSTSGMPIVASDPHIDARRLPGFWYPLGLITPEVRVIGAVAAGSPGVGLGRTNDIAWGLTNGYGDMVDLYLEQTDPKNPNHYLEAGQSIPLSTREVTLRIKDDQSATGFRSQKIVVRATKRGPIISDHNMGDSSQQMISLRWAAPEFMQAKLGSRDLLLAKNVDQALTAIGFNAMPLTFVIADQQGNIARTGAGFIPRRVRGDGAAPLPVIDGSDSWDGRIAPTEMPRLINPDQSWLGSANHRILDKDYPYHYSTFFAHSWRYRRIVEQMQAQPLWAADDHWRLQLDNKNMFAERLAPLMAETLLTNEETKPLGELLSQWDFNDQADRPEPLIFQSLLRHFAKAVVFDELGEALSKIYLNDYYYWHERIYSIAMDENSPWLDDINTAQKETRQDLFLRAGLAALAELVPLYGSDASQWRWGDAHTITFSHPLIKGKWAADWFGGGTHPMAGSGETINRGAYKYHQPYETTFFASMRVVMDMADPDKIEAHIPGGISERLFDANMTNMLPSWLQGKPDYWWFSDKAIAAHSVSEMILTP